MMVKYQVTLQIKSEPGQAHSYSLDLNLSQENNPQTVFDPEIRQRMRESLQRQSGCKIDDIHLKRMIDAWIEDIREGYRYTDVILDLPLLIASNLNNVREGGYQDIPPLIPPDLSEIEPNVGAFPSLIFS